MVPGVGLTPGVGGGSGAGLVTVGGLFPEIGSFPGVGWLVGGVTVPSVVVLLSGGAMVPAGGLSFVVVGIAVTVIVAVPAD